MSDVIYFLAAVLLAHGIAAWWIAGTERRVQRALKRQTRENELRRSRLMRVGRVVRV